MAGRILVTMISTRGVQAESLWEENDARLGFGIPGPTSESQGLFRADLKSSLIL